jgi:hypothetical protein
MAVNSPMPHALTIDTEDWSAVMCAYMGHTIPVSPQFGSTIHRLLDLLDEYHVRATFFVVAKHAADAPEPIRAIVARGHELASHGWTHSKAQTFSLATFREDLHRSVQTLQNLTAQRIFGHRVPFFSLKPAGPRPAALKSASTCLGGVPAPGCVDAAEALEAMAEAGLEYDSSVATLLWHRQGFSIPDQPFIFRLPSGATLVEFPIPARKLGPLTVRLIGGRGIRLAPAGVCLRHLRDLEQAGLPAMMYVHSYEIARDKLAAGVPRSLGLHRLAIALAACGFEVGRGRMVRLVRHMLANHRWAPARDVIARLRDESRLPTVEWPHPA